MHYLLILLVSLTAISCQEASDDLLKVSEPSDAQINDPPDVQISDPPDVQISDPPDVQISDPPDAQISDPPDFALRPWIFTANLEVDSPNSYQVNSIEQSDHFWVIDIGDGEFKVTTDVVLPFEVGETLGLTLSTVTGNFEDLYEAVIVRDGEGSLLFAGQSTPIERVDAPTVASMFNDDLGLVVELGGIIDTYELEYGRTSTHSLRFHLGENEYEINPGQSQAVQIDGRNFTLTVGLVNTWDERRFSDLYEWIEWILVAQPE